jgi:hypothetical protein
MPVPLAGPEKRVFAAGAERGVILIYDQIYSAVNSMPDYTYNFKED